jgi:hypothetical protein
MPPGAAWFDRAAGEAYIVQRGRPRLRPNGSHRHCCALASRWPPTPGCARSAWRHSAG